MNKIKKLFATTLALAVGVSSLTIVACGDDNDEDNPNGTSSVTGTFSYATEMLSDMDDISEGYNSDLFYVNTLEFEIADPSVIYITEGDEAGYFYAYGTSDEINCQGFQAWRSKDLSHWESMGVAYMPEYNNTWAAFNYWAPEVIYDEDDELYYMFYNAYNLNDDSHLWLSVAVSDSPAGPFETPDGMKDANGDMMYATSPVFDVTDSNPAVVARATEWYEENHLTSSEFSFIRTDALDASPFIDPATGAKYLYFSYYNNYGEGSFIYGMKMIDWYTPDYSTLEVLTCPGYVSLETYLAGMSAGRTTESGVNEGPFMYYANGQYYLTFSVYGYTDPQYQVKQAISDSPLGTFVKVDENDGGKVVSTDTGNWIHIVSAGHHSFIQIGDELFIAYHTFKDRNSIAGGRALAVDRVVWTENSEGTAVMHTNGPTWSVQPLPEDISGYKNLAESATITADKTASDSDVSLLNDGIVKYQEYDLAEEYIAEAGTSTIKLSWDSWKTVRGFMVYNTYDFDMAFESIDKVQIEYLTASGESAILTVTDVPFDWDWHSEISIGYDFLRPGGAAIAEFDELAVKSITFTISSITGSEYLGISEIYVLGTDTACAGVSTFSEYSYTNSEHASSTIVKDSVTFGSIDGTTLSTGWGYDLTNDDGTDDAYILQEGPSDQYAYFKDIYNTSFYIEAKITVTESTSYPLSPYLHDPYPKFGIAISCDDNYSNTLFYYVDGASGSYTGKTVGVAQRTLDNSDWDWSATEQSYGADVNYLNGNYVTLGVIRSGKTFYFLCDGKLVATYSSFNIFNDTQKAGVGFLSFNTPMKITDYYATDDTTVVVEKIAQYEGTLNGDTFGTIGNYSTTSGWDLTTDTGSDATLVNTATGDQYAYFRNINSTTFTVETEITVTKDLGDDYPKFGIVTCVGDYKLFFYIDGGNSYTNQSVGWVTWSATDSNWTWNTTGKSGEANVSGLSYTNGDYAKLKMVRDGGTFYLYAEDTLVFTLTDLEGFGESTASVAAVLSFTTGVTIRNYSASTTVSAASAQTATLDTFKKYVF